MDMEKVEKHREKLSKIKLFLTDVDGILTDGHITWMGEEVGWARSFHVRDGYGLKVLARLGLKVGIVSGGDSQGLKERIDLLGALPYSSIGNEDKREGYLEILKKAQVKDEEVLYLGDEYFDIPILKRVGFSATVAPASKAVKDVCDYVCEVPPGQGCVREVIDMLLLIQGKEPEVPDFD